MNGSLPIHFAHDAARRIWNESRMELLYVLWGLMEITIIAPVALAFLPWAQFWSQGAFVVWLFGLMLIPFNINRLGHIVHIPVERRQTITVLALLVTILIAWRFLLHPTQPLFSFKWLAAMFNSIAEEGNPLWRRHVALFVVIVVVWWRGIALAGRAVDIDDTGLRFRTGVLLCILLVAGLAGSLVNWSVTPFILSFFAVSLLALVLTRIEQLEVSLGAGSFKFSLKWALTVIFTAVLVVLLAGALAGFLGGDSVDQVVGWMAPLWLSASFLAVTAGSMLNFLIVPLMAVVSWLVQRLYLLLLPIFGPAWENLELITPEPMFGPPASEVGEAAENGLSLPQQILPILAMLFVVLLVALAVRQISRMIRSPAGFERESAGPDLTFGGIKELSLGKRILSRLGLWQRLRAAASIRRIYMEMSSMAATYGYPRLEHETPFEYLKTLELPWPSNRDEYQLITGAYVKIRYGEYPESRQELEEIVDAWKRLKAVTPAESDGTFPGVRIETQE